VPDDQLALKGTHPKYGTLMITEWTEFFLLHEAHHLFTLFRLSKALSFNSAGLKQKNQEGLRLPDQQILNSTNYCLSHQILVMKSSGPCRFIAAL
jgi:hypothetical protein